MPVIKVWCLPPRSENELETLFNDIIKAEIELREFNFMGALDTTVLFPPDMMKFGLGTDIVIEAGSKAFAPDKCSQESRDRFAHAMAETVAKHFPASKIESFVYSYNVGIDCGYALVPRS